MSATIPDTETDKKYRPEVLQIAYTKELMNRMQRLSQHMEGLTQHMEGLSQHMEGLAQHMESLTRQFTKFLELTIPEGKKDEVVVPVIDQWRAVPGNFPWFSFDMFNDGPNPVYFEINGHGSLRDDAAPINPRESVSVNPEAKVIRSVHVICAHGGQASLRFQALK